ncbi:DUF5691 domain-containing protein [Singulisphaera sp. PoT]|uniref:DUF5691 domain-containing protein n=1 Tax=Singulisphaera sp. PoT TaxID=3411797 RepID=UPI003BF574F5
MATVWSAEQVLALAPDAGSAKSGKDLSSPKKWKSLGVGEEILWGECQGSGSSPYQTKISLAEPAFHCSCPSRKFPCKHSLGLLLIWANQATAFDRGAPPVWVASWLEGRAKRADQKAQKDKERQEKIEKGEAVVDTAAQKKREQARSAKVDAGLEDLGLWMGDLLRQGLASLQSQGADPWEEQARRMIDAQAPGLARRLRQISALPLSGDGWNGPLLDRLARLHLVIEGKRRVESLPEDLQAEVRSVIGFPVDQNEVRARPGVRDVWQVIGQRVEVEDRLRSQRTWLVGRNAGKPAQILDFAYGSTQSLDATLTPGFQFEAELAYFPGAFPLRALIKERFGPTEALTAPAGHTSIATAYAGYAKALTRTPWLELYPLCLEGVTLGRSGESWLLRDAEGLTLPLSPQFGQGWELLGISGGQPFAMAGEFDGQSLTPLASWFEGRYQMISYADSEPTTRGASPIDAPENLAAFWKELSASALIGVERRPAPTLPVTSALAASNFGDSQGPAQLLGLAAASTLYHQVGRKPGRDSSPAITPPPPDERPQCEGRQSQRLERILNGDHFQFLEECLGLLDASGLRLEGSTLPELLTKARQDSKLRRPLLKVIGNRGRWLASLNPDWAFAAVDSELTDFDATWQTGTRAERRQALRSARANDPAKGLVLVTSTWTKETADDRAAFVEALVVGLGMDDEQFLEAALDDKSKQVRKAAAELLTRLPESRLCARMIERAGPLLAFSEAPVKGRKPPTTARAVAVSPPSGCDKAMIRDGIEAKPPTGTGERSWWLEQVVASTPLETWCRTQDDTPERLVKGLVEHKSEWNELLWRAWAAASTRSRNATWALALLANPPEDDDTTFPLVEGLLSILPTTDRDTFLFDLLRSSTADLGEKHPAFNLLQQCEGELEIGLAREVLHRVRRPVDEELDWLAREDDDGFQDRTRPSPRSRRLDYELYPFITGLARMLPPSLIEEAEFGFPEVLPSGVYFCTAYREFLDALRFRHEMHEEFAR